MTITIKAIFGTIISWTIAVFALYNYYSFDMPKEADLLAQPITSLDIVEEKTASKNGNTIHRVLVILTNDSKKIVIPNNLGGFHAIRSVLQNSNHDLTLFIWKEPHAEAYQAYKAIAANQTILTYQTSKKLRSGDIFFAKLLGYTFLVLPLFGFYHDWSKAQKEKRNKPDPIIANPISTEQEISNQLLSQKIDFLRKRRELGESFPISCNTCQSTGLSTQNRGAFIVEGLCPDCDIAHSIDCELSY